MLCDIVCQGGNLLLDIGPTADGRIPVIMQQPFNRYR
jgi:alpha-L-fucosidase